MKNYLFLFLISFAFFSCKKDVQENVKQEAIQIDETNSVDKKYTLTELSSPKFPEASLELTNVEEGETIAPGEFTFEFDVKNYELGQQTPDASEKGLANSGKGQHIHFILNNDPYSAHYEPMVTKDLPEGKHVLVAFLARSYHESVKNGQSFIVRSFQVGNSEEGVDFNPDGQHMLYSRPKGTYKGGDTDKLLLDFYLLNTTLSEDGNKVKATINGEEHIITKWAPYVIEGLEKGELTLKLELIDADGNMVPGPFNMVERTVTLAEADTME